MSEPILEVLDLSKRFGGFTAVSELAFELAPGELLGLLGPNGAGKTTTMRLLMGLLRASAGTARVAGLDCFNDRVEVKRLVGYLPDEPVFHDYLRGSEILRFVGQMHGLTRAEVELTTTAFAERLDLADALEEFAINYSLGMRKKLALVCALMHRPRLLILDEPTSGLDPLATRWLHELLLEQAAQGVAVLLSSHLLEQVQRLCGRVAILTQGKLAALGTLQELRQRASNDSSLEEIFFAVTTPGPV